MIFLNDLAQLAKMEFAKYLKIRQRWDHFKTKDIKILIKVSRMLLMTTSGIIFETYEVLRVTKLS